ncbi:MAG TPA: hypothetical protein VMT18_09420, partial [Planctomycetota bacterium]|nr:hypothetical protein [Planctomycetota bacterium]
MIQFCLTGFSTACFVLSAGGAQASSLPHAKATAFLEELQLSSKNLGLAGEVLDADPDLDASAVLVAVSEANQGGTDLNGDGDTFDSVLHVLPRGSDVLVNLGLALPTGGVPVQAAHIAGDQVLFLVREVEQGVDLNGDG